MNEINITLANSNRDLLVNDNECVRLTINLNRLGLAQRTRLDKKLLGDAARQCTL